MYKLICQKFIRNYQQVEDSHVRESYGIVFSLVSIVLNLIMVIFKLFVAFLTSSVSIQADALNNLSDVGSNMAALFGFRLSNRHPDSDHPYGHGRYEYISSLIIAMLIVLMGFSAAKEALMKIIRPEASTFSLVAVVILVFSIAIKLLMANINQQAALAIDSNALHAASQDSKNDAVMTSATLLSLLVYRFFHFDPDAYVAMAVSVMVIKSGVEIFKDTSDTILGKAADKTLIKEIEDFVMSFAGILGIHDLVFHDYGPSRVFLTLHAEVDCHEDVVILHDTIDNIEKNIMEKFGIYATIHLDPIDTSNEELNYLKEEVYKIVKNIDHSYNIHDFRMVSGPTHTNLIFDLVIPPDSRANHEEIKQLVSQEISKLSDKYFCVIEVEHSYV